jgi:hypothetical protein
MRQLSITPRITVTIGHHTRQYFAFVTTAPAALDAPATLTLHRSTWSDIVGLAVDPLAVDDHLGRLPGRLVLVEAMEMAWQRARIRGHHHVFRPADAALVSPHALQQCLWRRLHAAGASQVTT